MSTTQNDALHLAQKFLSRMSSGAEPHEIANLFSENMAWEIAGDAGILPWIGQKSGRAAIINFVTDSRVMIERKADVAPRHRQALHGIEAGGIFGPWRAKESAARGRGPFSRR